MEKKELSLVYVDIVGKNGDDMYEYDFYYSETPEDVWGFEWDKAPASYCVDLLPEPSTYSEIERIKTPIPLSLIQNNTFFSIEDCVNGVVALCYEDISNYEVYPEPYRIVFKFGENRESIIEKLNSRNKENLSGNES